MTIALASANAAISALHTKRIIGPTILLGDGAYFDFEAPDAAGMTIEDYAWGLASNNRFCGQTRYRVEDAPNQCGSRVLYNVCQHVVIMAERVWSDGHPIEAVYEALMHESDEVTWPDIAGPAKLLLPAEAKALIKLSGDAIDRRFEVTHDHKDLVKQYDLRMLATEKRDLMPQSGNDEWAETPGYEPFALTISCWDAWYSVQRFLGMYRNIRASMGKAA